MGHVFHMLSCGKWPSCPVYPGGFPLQKSVTRSFIFSLACAWTKGRANNRDAGDLKRHHAHYNVTVMGSNGIDIFLPDYSGFSTGRVKVARWVTGLKGCFPSENVYSYNIEITNILHQIINVTVYEKHYLLPFEYIHNHYICSLHVL